MQSIINDSSEFRKSRGQDLRTVTKETGFLYLDRLLKRQILVKKPGFSVSPRGHSAQTPPIFWPHFGRIRYVQMFDLDLTQWQGCRILDCAAGPASFVAEANRMGFEVLGCDILYRSENYLWNFFQSVKNLRRHRTEALRQFAADYAAGVGKRCIYAKLPENPCDRDRRSKILLCA